MPDTLNIAADIYEGFWINWSQGKVWGLTWTMDQTSAVVLTNSLAMFVALAGVQLWAIIRYTLHYRGATASPHVATPHLSKEQVILRNVSSPFGTAQALLDLAWTSRRSNGKRSLRAWAIGLSAIFYAALFALASVFSNNAVSSQKINGGSAVLFRSSSCGIWNATYYNMVALNGKITDSESFNVNAEYHVKGVNEVRLSTEYAHECYLSQLSHANTSSTCRTLKQPTLNWTSTEAACPFDSKICLKGTNAIVFDTGEIDSHNDLGINAKPEERLRYRGITKCAPLDGTGRIQGWNGLTGNFSNLDPSVRQAAYAYYGPSIFRNTSYTYSYSDFSNFYDNFSSLHSSPYTLEVEGAWAPTHPQWTDSDFEPIPELAQTEADLSLHFLSFNGMYLGQIDDPWFSAHDVHHEPSVHPFLGTRYARDLAIGTLGCTQQYNFCTEKGCTGLLGFDQIQNNNTFNRALTPHQNATFDRMLRAVGGSSLARMAAFLYKTPNTSLLANNLALGGSSGAFLSQVLPSDQWKSEVTFWYATSMANIQRSIALWATGGISPKPKYLIPAVEEQDSWFCTHFMVPSTNYQSFNVVPIIIISVCGVLVIIAGSVVEDLAGVIRRSFRESIQRKQWDCDHMLWLPRFPNQDEHKPAPLPKDEKYASVLRQSHVFSRLVQTSAPPAYKELGISVEAGTPAKLAYLAIAPLTGPGSTFEAIGWSNDRHKPPVRGSRPGSRTERGGMTPEHHGSDFDRPNWI